MSLARIKDYVNLRGEPIAMKTEEKENIKAKQHNASPSAYGWAFQVGAGIKLMLKYVKEFTSLKMEGKNDDIEITLPQGKIYAQAKSITQMGEQSGARKTLKDALEVLKDDAKNSDSTQLIYISNILNPLSSSSKRSPFYDGYERIYDFSILPPADQNDLQKLVGSDFPIDQFQIHVIRFFGVGEEKFDGIREEIKGFVQKALGDSSYEYDLWAKWFAMFYLNCTDTPKEEMEFSKTKKEIMYPIIVLAIDPPISIDEFQQVSDYDDYDEIKKTYRKVINDKLFEYEFSSSVLGDYLSKKSHVAIDDRSKYKYHFVKETWKEYEENFTSIPADAAREAVTKMTILTTINRADKLEQIGRAANLW